jgi:hypothetical protein
MSDKWDDSCKKEKSGLNFIRFIIIGYGLILIFLQFNSLAI